MSELSSKVDKHELTEEDIKAKFEDGVLKLTVPKKEKEAVPAFYITSDNLTDPSVQPFLDFYKKK